MLASDVKERGATSTALTWRRGEFEQAVKGHPAAGVLVLVRGARRIGDPDTGPPQ